MRSLKLDIDEERERLLVVRVNDGLGSEREHLADLAALRRVVFGVGGVLDESSGTASSVSVHLSGEELREVVAIHQVCVLSTSVTQ